jgi:predicted nucleic-acid-binding Zn-ribbon protein
MEPVHHINLISGLLTPIGKTSREALISKEPTKFVVKICVNSRYNRFYQK